MNSPITDALDDAAITTIVHCRNFQLAKKLVDGLREMNIHARRHYTDVTINGRAAMLIAQYSHMKGMKMSGYYDATPLPEVQA